MNEIKHRLPYELKKHSDLEIGECFTFNNGRIYEEPMMKIQIDTDGETFYINGDDYKLPNAVCLKDGLVLRVHENEWLVPHKATIEVEPK
jgi:hypothetical protein